MSGFYKTSQTPVVLQQNNETLSLTLTQFFQCPYVNVA